MQKACVCVCVLEVNLTVIVPHYSDLSSGFTVLCGVRHQTADINSLPLAPYLTRIPHRVQKKHQQHQAGFVRNHVFG